MLILGLLVVMLVLIWITPLSLALIVLTIWIYSFSLIRKALCGSEVRLLPRIEIKWLAWLKCLELLCGPRRLERCTLNWVCEDILEINLRCCSRLWWGDLNGQNGFTLDLWRLGLRGFGTWECLGKKCLIAFAYFTQKVSRRLLDSVFFHLWLGIVAFELIEFAQCSDHSWIQIFIVLVLLALWDDTSFFQDVDILFRSFVQDFSLNFSSLTFLLFSYFWGINCWVILRIVIVVWTSILELVKVFSG